MCVCVCVCVCVRVCVCLPLCFLPSFITSGIYPQLFYTDNPDVKVKEEEEMELDPQRGCEVHEEVHKPLLHACITVSKINVGRFCSRIMLLMHITNSITE